MITAILLILGIIFLFLFWPLGIFLLFLTIVSLILKLVVGSGKTVGNMITQTKCPNCRSKISKKATICPHCQTKINSDNN